jgi:methionyl-tRNA formyltransferase
VRTLFIGGTRRGYLSLSALLDYGAHVVGIISLEQDQHESDRYEERIRTLAKNRGIPLYQTRWMKDRDYAELISQDIKPDICFVVGCRILIPKCIYELPPLECLGVHDSLLPEYRGFAPSNWSIVNGEDQTGVTLFYLSDLMDGGDIVEQMRIPIGSDDTAPVIYERVCQATVEVLLQVYPLLERGEAPRTKQSNEAGSFTCSRTPADGWIEWNQPTHTINNQIRALTYPYPGAFTVHQGKRLWIWKAEPVQNPPRYVGRIPGRVISVSSEEGHVDVLTGDGVLRVIEVQKAGEEKVAAACVIKSVRSTLGLRMSDLLERLELLEGRLAKLTGAQS